MPTKIVDYPQMQLTQIIPKYADGTALQNNNNKQVTTQKSVIASFVQDVKVAYLNNMLAKNVNNDQELTQSNLDLIGNVVPHKSNPLFNYLKNEHTLKNDNVIRFRNENNTNDVATIILKPVARAIAGDNGRAIATPLSRAILKPGTNVDILYEPDAVAIAGPGGVAHAQSDLEIFYEDS